MASSLSSLVDNPFEEIHRIKCKRRQNKNMTKIVKLVEVNIIIVTVFLNIETLKIL